jgi:hypothetical protein
LKGNRPFYETDKYIYVLVMGDPPFFLADLSLGLEAPPVSSLLLFHCVVKLILLKLT